MKFWNGWLTRFQRRHHEPTFLSTLEEIEHFKNLVKSRKCVACGQLTLELHKFVRGTLPGGKEIRGWDAEVSCTNCNFTGVVNSEGFDFANIHSKGKARE